MKITMAPVEPRPFASAMATTEARSIMTSSTTPTSASPPVRRATPGGNRSAGRSRRCSRQVGTTPTTASAAMPAVEPAARTSSAVSGSRASGSPRPSGTNSRQDVITTTLATAGPAEGAANLR